MKTIEVKRGDDCPICGGELQPARTLSADDYRRTFDRENPLPLPPGADTASPEQRAELGDLFTCARCGYKTRFAADASASSAELEASRARVAGSATAAPAPAARSAEDEISRLQRENAALRAQQANGASPSA